MQTQVETQEVVLPLSLQGGVVVKWHVYDMPTHRIKPVREKVPAPYTEEIPVDKRTGQYILELVMNTRNWENYEGYKFFQNGDVEEFSGDKMKLRLETMIKRNNWAYVEVAQRGPVYGVYVNFAQCMCANTKCGALFAPHALINPDQPQGHLSTRFCPDCAAAREGN